MLPINYLPATKSSLITIFLLLQIRLGPFEFLTGVSGTVGSFGTIPNVITSLMVTTNMGNSYGPLGQGGGTPFCIPVENNGCIVGFFGCRESCVEALGVYTFTHTDYRLF